MAGETSTLITFNKISNGNRRGAVNFPELGVILPFPREVKVETAYDWQTEELGVIGAALRNTTSEVIEGDLSVKQLGARTFSTDGATAAAANAANLVIGSGTGALSSGLAGAGIAVNPKEEVLFKGVKHRAFTLTFDLAPLTKADSIATMTFLSKLHVFAAPTLIGVGAFFKYPGTLTVTIMGTDGVVLDRRNCAISSIDCNMTPDSVWATFENGNPVHIMLTIGFLELTLPTADLEEGLFG